MLIKKILNHVKTNNHPNTPQGIITGVLTYLNDTSDGKILMANMLSGTPNGVEAMLDALACDRRPADNTKTYLIANLHEVDASEMIEFHGFTAKGFPVPPGSVTKEVLHIDQCESCGASCPSVDDATSYIDGSSQISCNHCRTYRSDIESSQIGDISVCQSCAKLDCSHHPKKRYMVQTTEANYQKIDSHGHRQLA
jgi:hypothetical protein